VEVQVSQSPIYKADDVNFKPVFEKETPENVNTIGSFNQSSLSNDFKNQVQYHN